ncbi:MAG: hypothetical protein FOGNACKC_01809 [Anaerolineae bacterium]|nr:hypothetical protein [Anaerolineae bacterium]
MLNIPSSNPKTKIHNINMVYPPLYSNNSLGHKLVLGYVNQISLN